MKEKRMTTAHYDKKAENYDCFRSDCPGWMEIKKLLPHDISKKSVLDLGCGSGAFLKKLQVMGMKELHGVDPSEKMVQVCCRKFESQEENPNLVRPLVSTQSLEEMEENRYDIVICLQVIQNLTSNPEEAEAARMGFYREISRVLKPGGILIVSTRQRPPNAGSISDQFWYANPEICPKAIETMNIMVPGDPADELASCGFAYTCTKPSTDLLFAGDTYLQGENLQNEAWQAADSFFQHVKGEEKIKMQQHIKELVEARDVSAYVAHRDLKRKGRGHVVVFAGVKPERRNTDDFSIFETKCL